MAGAGNRHKYSPWRRAILVPFWVLQTGFLLLFIGLLSLAVGYLSKNYDSSYDYGFGSSDSTVDQAVSTATNIVGPIYIALCAICLIITIAEIVLLVKRKLTQLKFLICNIIKSTIWTAMFIMDIIAYANANAGRRTTATGLGLDVIIMLLFWIPLIYASIHYHRFRKNRSAYAPVSHPLATPQADTSYPSQIAMQNQNPFADHVHPAHPPHYNPETAHGNLRTGYGVQQHTGHSHGDLGLAHNSPRIHSPPVPQVFVQHHDVYEIDNARRNH